MQHVSGPLRLEHLPKHALEMTVSAPGWSTETLTIPSDQGEHRLGSITLRPLIDLRGVVVDAFGGPVANAAVMLGDRTVHSDASGAFVMSAIPQGRHGVRAEHYRMGFGRTMATVEDETLLTVRLEQPVGGDDGWDQVLAQEGVTIARDGLAWRVVNIVPTSPWVSAGLSERDFLERVVVTEAGVSRLTRVRNGVRQALTPLD